MCVDMKNHPMRRRQSDDSYTRIREEWQDMDGGMVMEVLEEGVLKK